MLASCIMPTRNRPDFVRRAVACFLAQDYADRELVIVDDGDTPTLLLPRDERIRYHRLISETQRSIGAKRNIACARASGEVILHWDDDDWYAPGRITDQVARLTAARVPVSGYSSVLFADDARRRAWRYIGGRMYAVGTSLCYLREYWQTHPFIDSSEGEDNNFVQTAPGIATARDPGMIVASVHGGNTCPRERMLTEAVWSGAPGEQWQEVPYDSLRDVGYPTREAAGAAA